MHRRAFLKRMTWGMAMLYAGLPLAQAVAERAEADAPKRLHPSTAARAAVLSRFGPGDHVGVIRDGVLVHSSIVVRADASSIWLRDAMPLFPTVAGATYFVPLVPLA